MKKGLPVPKMADEAVLELNRKFIEELVGIV
jgi:hypothetical protein